MSAALRRYAVRRRRTPLRLTPYAVRRTPSPTPYITWNTSATVILLLDVDESTSEEHRHWTPYAVRRYAVRRYAVRRRRTPYADADAVRPAVRRRQRRI